MADQQRPPIKPTPLDVMSTWLFADPVAGGTKRPNFRLKVIGNVPRIVVKTNVPDDKNNGRIDFNTDVATFSAIMGTLARIARGETDQSYTFDYEDDFVAGKKLDRKIVLSSVKIGRDRDSGRIYIAVLSSNRPKIQFFFGPSQYHNVRRGDGSEVPAGEISSMYALAFVEGYKPIIDNLLVSEFNPDAKNVAKMPTGMGGQGGGGGGYNKQQGGGGYNKPAAPTFDDDVDDSGW